MFAFTIHGKQLTFTESHVYLTGKKDGGQYYIHVWIESGQVQQAENLTKEEFSQLFN